MSTARRYFRLRAFVLGSALVHALLLVAWSSSSMRFGAVPQPPLSVRLEGARAANNATQRPDTSASRTATATESAPTMERADAGRVAARTPVATGVVETGNHDEVRARIEAQLHTSLARHFDYPYVARLRGWEGRVLLAFIVQASGDLNDIRIVRSSGFTLLDDSAVDSLKKVQHLPEAVAWLQGRDIEMQLPVIYRLKGEH